MLRLAARRGRGSASRQALGCANPSMDRHAGAPVARVPIKRQVRKVRSKTCQLAARMIMILIWLLYRFMTSWVDESHASTE